MSYQEYLLEQIEVTLEYLVAETDRPMSYYRELLAEVDIKTIDDLDNFQDYFEADYVAERIRSGKDRVYSWEEVWGDLELGG